MITPIDRQIIEANAITPPDALSTGTIGSSSGSDTSKRSFIQQEFENLSVSPINPLKDSTSSLTRSRSTHQGLNSSDSWCDLLSSSVSRDSMRKDDIIIPSFSVNTWRSSLRPSKSRTPLNEERSEKSVGISSNNPFLNTIFKTAMFNYNIDLPLCMACAKIYLQSLQDELDYVEYDIESYEDYCTQLDHGYFNTDHYSEEIQKLDTTKNDIFNKLEELRTNQEQLSIEIEASKEEEEQLKIQTIEYWAMKNVEDHKILLAQNEMTSIENSDNFIDRLEILRSSNVVQDAFQISTDGHYAMINGLRLSKLPVFTADIMEIMSALGFLGHLFVVMTNSFGIKYKMFYPKISGSNILMIRIKDKSAFQLSAENEGLRAKLGLHKSNTLGAFLRCVVEFIEKIHSKDPNFEINHTIDFESCTIDDAILKKGIQAPDEHFTKGFKSLLTILKRILLWLTENKYL